MAIDPSISLAAGPAVPEFDPFGAATKGMNLALLAMRPQQIQQQLALGEQEILKAKEEVTRQRRENVIGEETYQGEKTLREIIKRNVKAVEGSSGKLNVDHRAVALEASQAGLPTAVVWNHLSKAAENESAQFKNDKDRYDFVERNAASSLDIVRTLKDPASAVTVLKGMIDADARATGMPIDVVAKQYEKWFGGLGPNENIVQRAENVRKGLTVSPQQAIANQQAQERIGIEQFGAITSRLGEYRAQDESFTSPDAKNANSDVSKNMRAILGGFGYTVDPTLSSFDIMRNPVYKAIIDSNIPSAGARVQAKEGAAVTGATATVVENAIASAEIIGKKFGTRAGSITQDAVNKFVMQDPEFARLQAAIDEYNKRNGTDISIAKDGIAAVRSRLLVEREKLRAIEKSQKEVSTTTAIGGNKVEPNVQAVRDAERVKILEQEYRNAKTQSDKDAIGRELKRMGVNPPAEGGQATPAPAPKPAAEVVRIRDKETKKVYAIPKDDPRLQKALSSGKYERL